MHSERETVTLLFSIFLYHPNWRIIYQHPVYTVSFACIRNKRTDELFEFEKNERKKNCKSRGTNI